METFELTQEFIPLNALMKVLDWVPSGGVANQLITDGEVVVNGEVELRKRRKLRTGDQVQFMDREVEVAAPASE